jgi:hypothetical protein
MAQKAPELDRLIRFASTISPLQEKYIHEVLKGIEPDIGVWVDAPNQQVKVRGRVELHRDELEGAWSAIGLVISYFGPIITQHLEERGSTPPVSIPGSEDGVADAPGHQAAKAAWIAAHPKEYQQLSDPLAPR